MKIFPLALTILVYSAGVAQAECDLSSFDSSEPNAVSDTTQGRFTKFKWASDEDPSPDGDGKRAWHYVRNLHEDGLALIWAKIDEFIPIRFPLGKDEVACFQKFSQVFEIDDDAPIMTTREGAFPAKAYIPTGTSRKTGAGVGRDGDGFSGHIEAIIRYFRADRYLSLSLNSSSDDIVFGMGFTGLGISEKVLATTLADELGSEPAFEGVANIYSSDDKPSLMFFEAMTDDRVMKLSFSGSLEFGFNDVTEIAAVKIPLVMLNADGEILAATKIDLSPLVEN